MKATEYIEKFHINDPNRKYFKHRDFLRAMAEEFNLLVSASRTYRDFTNSVAYMDAKFKEIESLRTVKGGFSNKLWKAFYAIYVVPKRASLFPQQQEKVENWRNAKGSDTN